MRIKKKFTIVYISVIVIICLIIGYSSIRGMSKQHNIIKTNVIEQRLIEDIVYEYTIRQLAEEYEANNTCKDTGEGSAVFFCIRGKDCILQIESGPMGGWEEITGLSLVNVDETGELCPQTCVAEIKLDSFPNFRVGLTLRMDSTKAVQMMGAPNRVEEGTFIYESEQKVLASKEHQRKYGVKSYYELHVYEIRFKKGLVYSISYYCTRSDPE